MSEVKPKVALITGITGQDGSYLAEFLLAKGYIVSHSWRSKVIEFSLGRSLTRLLLVGCFLFFRRFMELSVAPLASIPAVLITSTEIVMRLESICSCTTVTCATQHA